MPFVPCPRVSHTASGPPQRRLLIRPLIRRLAIGLFLLNVLAVTWPVVTLFRSSEPLVFGLPLSMAWPIAWILLGWIMLLVLDHFENKDQSE